MWEIKMFEFEIWIYILFGVLEILIRYCYNVLEKKIFNFVFVDKGGYLLSI